MSIQFMEEDIILAVKRGAYWLDENHPDWVEKIDLSLLKMNNCHSCIIGQAVGNYYSVIDNIEDDTWAEENGFQAPPFMTDYTDEEGEIYRVYDWQAEYEYYAGLETVWTDEVKKRLG